MKELIVLGTSSMVPTHDRNHTAFAIAYEGELLLIDCGEGTQRQLRIAGLKPSKVSRIFITHWHGDHVLGLPGLLQTMDAQEYEGTLVLYGPPGTKEQFAMLMNAFQAQLTFPVKVMDVAPGKICKGEGYTVLCEEMDHNVACYAYQFVEHDRLRIDTAKAKRLGLKEGPLLGKLQQGHAVTHDGKKIKPEDVTYKVHGKKITFVLDTAPTERMIDFAAGSDLLVCESTYAHADREKAYEYKHLTSSQAAQIAQQAGVKKLLLTHFSQRYASVDELLSEAKVIFPETQAAFDFMKIKI